MKNFKSELTQTFVDTISIPGTYIDTVCPGLQLIVSEHGKRYQVRQKTKGRSVKKGIGKASDYSLKDARATLQQIVADVKDGSTSLSKKATEDYLKHCLAKLGGKIVITPADRKMAEQKRLLVEEAGKNISITLTTNKRKV